MIHEHPTGGHQGINRTIARCADEFFWPGWRKAIASLVRSCATCQQRKDPQAATSARPRQQIVSQGRNDLIAIDLQGPLTSTLNSNQHIMVIQCLYTKFVVAVPIPDCTSETIANAFVSHWIGYFGTPARLLTDNAQYFASDLIAEMCVLLRIQKLWTSPYHPQSDPVERVNRTFNAMLSHFVNDRQDNWDSFLPLICVAYNTTFNATTGHTPYFLMMGHNPLTLADFLINVPQTENSSWGEGAKAAMHTALRAAYKDIIHRQQQRQESIEEENKQIAFEPYKVGEEVLLLDTTTPAGLKPKYRRRWTGPYMVVACNGPLSYVVESKDGLRVYRAHAEHLKRTYRAGAGLGVEAQHWPSQTSKSLQRLETSMAHEQQDVTHTAAAAPGVSLRASSPGIGLTPLRSSRKINTTQPTSRPQRPQRPHRMPIRYRDEAETK